MVNMKMQDVDTSYDAYFARKEREAAKLNLDDDTLQRDIRLVRQRLRALNRGLIKENNPYMAYLDVGTMFALIFTATVSPYEIAFIPEGTYLSLALANYLVLVIFAIGMVCSFFQPYREPLWMGGSWITNHQKIAWKYLTSWFLIDLLSTIPLDQIVMLSMASPSDCSGADCDNNDDASSLRAIRGVRLARLIRLTRLVKLGRLARATRILSRLAEHMEKHSELLNISYTVRTAMFWMAVVLVIVHWFACTWGIVALLQETQRTPQLLTAVDDACQWDVAEHLNRTLGESNQRASDCLIECEVDVLAEINGVKSDFVRTSEPWMCRRIDEGLFTGANGADIYYYLLHHEGMMKNVGGKTGRPEENVIFFVLSYLYLVLRTVFIGAISGARANANPLGRAWQGRMDHLNLFLREMNAPYDLRLRTRNYLRNTRDLELKKSFGSLYGNFSRGLAGEMMSIMSISIVRRVSFFANCEAAFLRDLTTKMSYEAFDRGEYVSFAQLTLGIVLHGTLVVGGRPISGGKCVFSDILLHSDSLRDRRHPVALTYCEVCCLTRKDIFETAEKYPDSAKELRFEGFKMAMYRSTQMVAQYVDSVRITNPDLDHKAVGVALCNLGEGAEQENLEVHTYFRAINGGAKLRGIAKEQLNSQDSNIATKAREAYEMAVESQSAPPFPNPEKVLIDEDGNVLEEQLLTKLELQAKEEMDPMKRLAKEVRDEMKETREEMRSSVLEMREMQEVGMQQMRDEIRAMLSRPGVAKRRLRKNPTAESVAADQVPNGGNSLADVPPTQPQPPTSPDLEA